MSSDNWGSRKRIRENSYSVETKIGSVIELDNKLKLEERTAYLSQQFIATAKERWWYDIFIVEWFRTTERQKQLYSQWRTKKWKIVTYIDWVNRLSDHQLWIAFDIAFKWDVLYPKDNKIWDNLSDLATELWLKSWRREWWWDKPHFRHEQARTPKWFDELVSEYTQINPEIFKKVEQKHLIKKELLVCIVQSETSWGKNIKSKNNVSNIWNHDSWKTRDFDSIEENIMELWNKLKNWEYLKQWNIVWELSCQWRALLWRKDCGKYMYASDSKNRHTNVSKCLTKITWKEEDWLRWKYKK